MTTETCRKFSDAWESAYRWRARGYGAKLPVLQQRRMEKAWDRALRAEAVYLSRRKEMQ